jgi:hypothetical protein
MVAQPILSARRTVKPILTPRRRNVPETVKLLCNRHGEAKARKLAEREQKRARQARSRKQFEFWAAVVVEIELRRGIAPDDRDAKGMRLAGQMSGEGVGTEFFGGTSR